MSQDRLIRVLLLRVRAEEHLLVLNIHHIVSDEWSLKVFFREFSELYAAFIARREVALPESPIRYVDYAIWQRERMRGEYLERQLAYWRRQLANPPPPTAIPTDYPRPATPTFRGGRRHGLWGKN